ncbi:MAG: serine protein kinase RIO [Halieaceae bacterium]|nr:serine protein kinase RIO [Halieaceae bacterium]
MKTPNRIVPLIEDGVIDEVLQQLMSGKEATVYVVRCGREIRCAKVYKEVAKRSFKQAVQYKEGRKGGNSRRQRAIDKGSKYGRKQQEAEWHDTEVNALYQLERAGVRVPEPFGCFDGVLLMELVTTEDGDVAPRLNDVVLTREQALEDHATVMSYVVKMLCLGMVHGDLSEFNVLVDDYGPVIIDLPQAVNAAGNNHARSMLERDINNITAYYGQSAPELLVGHYADEIWALYEAGELHPDTQLTGDYSRELVAADTDSILLEIEAALKDESDRLARIRDANEG